MSDVRPAVHLVDEHGLRDARERARSGLGGLRLGFDLPGHPWALGSKHWTCVGVVADAHDAEAALVASVRGVDLVIQLTLAGDPRRRFVDDLARTGSFDRPRDVIGPVSRMLLDSLADGDSLTQAATKANVSRRTAHRRMAEVRTHYGVKTTSEAVVRWVVESSSAS